MVMYMARKFTPGSLTTIGKHYGKNHTTVLHANKKIDKLLAENNHIKKDIYFLSERLRLCYARNYLPALPADSS